MNERVFTTFKIWDDGILSKKEVLNVAYDHFIDLQETFDLGLDASMRQINVTVYPNRSKEYVFEILKPVFIREQ